MWANKDSFFFASKFVRKTILEELVSFIFVSMIQNIKISKSTIRIFHFRLSGFNAKRTLFFLQQVFCWISVWIEIEILSSCLLKLILNISKCNPWGLWLYQIIEGSRTINASKIREKAHTKKFGAQLPWRSPVRG